MSEGLDFFKKIMKFLSIIITACVFLADASAVRAQMDGVLDVPPELDVETLPAPDFEIPEQLESEKPSEIPNSAAEKTSETVETTTENSAEGVRKPLERTENGLLIAQAESEKAATEALDSQVEKPSEEERVKLLEELAKNREILQAQSNVVKIVAKLIAPSVVHIESVMYKRGARGEKVTLNEAGSGVIVFRNEKFYVLTNRHVLREAVKENIQIKLYDNRITHPIAVLYDAETDIAVLELAETDLISATLGDSNVVEIGEFVLAVGSPFGLNHSVTFGIISAKGRRELDIDANVHLQDFLQTDAAINPGNSGGPLVNLNGEVIGINTAIASNSGGSEGIGFSIPIRMVMLVADQLIRYGKARRAYLGVTLDSEFNAQKAKVLGLPRANGACVKEVTPYSPAAKANFAVNDVILKFNGAAVEDEKHLYNLVNLAAIGIDIPVTVFREGKVYKIQIQLQER